MARTIPLSLGSAFLAALFIAAAAEPADCFTQAQRIPLTQTYSIACDAPTCTTGVCEFDSSESGGVYKHWCECSSGGSSNRCNGYLLSNSADPEDPGYSLSCFENHTCEEGEICDEKQVPTGSYDRLCDCLEVPE